MAAVASRDVDVPFHVARTVGLPGNGHHGVQDAVAVKIELIAGPEIPFNGPGRVADCLTRPSWQARGWMDENLDQIGDLMSLLNRSDEFKEGFGPIRLDYTKKSDKSWGMTQFQYICKTTDLSN